VYVLPAINDRDVNFWLSIPLSYLAIIYIVSGIGYIESYITVMGENVFTLYGQLSLIFVSGSIFLILIALISLYLSVIKLSGYSFGLGIILYVLGRILFILNNGGTLSLTLKSPLVFMVLLILSSLFFILSTIKIDESRSIILALIATIFFFASWFYNGYMSYTHFDPNDIYGIIRGSLIESLKASFAEPIYIYFGGPLFPLVLIGVFLTLLAFWKAGSFDESSFIRVSSLGTVLIALLGSSMGFYPNFQYLIATLDSFDYFGISSFDNTYGVAFNTGFTVATLILLFASLISVFNLFSVGIKYEIETVRGLEEKEERRKIGIVAREGEKEELEGIEDIDLEDLDLEL